MLVGTKFAFLGQEYTCTWKNSHFKVMHTSVLIEDRNYCQGHLDIIVTWFALYLSFSREWPTGLTVYSSSLPLLQSCSSQLEWTGEEKTGY